MPTVSKYPGSATYERVEKNKWGTYTETTYNYIDRVKKADGSYAYTSTIASKSGTASKPGRIKTYNYRMGVPAGARVDSITVEWKNYIRNPSGGTTGVPNIPSVKVNLLGNTTLQSKVKTKSAVVPTSATVWSLTWTASETGLTQEQLLQVVNSGGFGAYINPSRNTNYNTGIYYIDYVKITVSYSVPNWTLVASDSVGASQDKRNISVSLRDTNGVVKSGKYSVSISLSDGLVIDSVGTCEGSLSGDTWDAQIQSDSQADLSFVVRTTLTGTAAHSVTFRCTPPGSNEVSDTRAFSLTLAPQGVNGVTPSYTYTLADEYTALPSTGSYSTDFTVTNSDASSKTLNVYYDTTDYSSYTVTGGSFSPGNPGVWTVNASSTSTLKLKYNPTGKRFIKIVEASTSTVLFRRLVVPYDYYEQGYGGVEYPVNDERNGEYRFRALIRAITDVTYPHLKLGAPGVGYNVYIYDLSGNVIKTYPFGSYALYDDYVLVDFTFTTSNGVGKVRIDGMASYTDWDKSKYQLNILTPSLTFNGGIGTGGVLFFDEGSGVYSVRLDPDEESQEYSFQLNAGGLEGKNVYGVRVVMDYEVEGGDDATVSLYLYNQSPTGDLADHRSTTLQGTGKVKLGGAGGFLGFDTDGGILENLNDHTLLLQVKNHSDTPVRVKLVNPRVEALYTADYDGEGFTFNGKHSSQFNVNITELNGGYGEKRNVKFYDLLNTDMKVVSRWEGDVRVFEMKCLALADGLDEGQELIRYISEWLSTDFWTDGSADYGLLSFDFDDQVEYKVLIEEPIQFNIKAPGFIELTVKLTILEAYNRAGGTGGPSGTVKGVRSVRPTLKILGTGGPVKIIESVSGKQLIFRSELSAETVLYVDCRRRRVYDEKGEVYSGIVDLGSDWFELKGAYDFSRCTGCKVLSVSYTEHY